MPIQGTEDNENERRRRDRPKGLSLQRGLRGYFQVNTHAPSGHKGA